MFVQKMKMNDEIDTLVDRKHYSEILQKVSTVKLG